MAAHLVEPGSVLDDRYVIEDLLTRDGEAESWRAHDKILARSVVLQIVPKSSPLAEILLASAKRASRVADTRILQVLDAVDDGQLAYVVREWASGQSLNVVLSEGPLAARRAAWLVREVAGAMVNAHRHGIAHRRLSPEAVVVTKSSGVKVIGLGTAAALRGEGDGSESDERSELDDTQDLGRLLYACLTARWPGGEAAGLPVAPTEHGRLLRPRQVRAGVPRTLDAVCDRILAHQSRYGPPITTVAEVKDALVQVLAEEGMVSTSSTSADMSASATPSSPHRVEPPPALLYRDGEEPPTGEQPVVGNGERRGSLGRTLGWSALLIFIAGAVLLAYLIGQNGTGSSDTGKTPATSGATSGGTSSTASPLQIASAVSFDPKPQGSGDENPDEVSRAFDDDPASAWSTLTYTTDPHLGNLKDGVGLVLDLGSPQSVSEVDVSLTGDGTDLELRAAPEDAASYPTASADDYALVGSLTGQGSKAVFTLDKPVTTRYLLVWLTSLPQVSAGHYQGGISDIVVSGG